MRIVAVISVSLTAFAVAYFGSPGIKRAFSLILLAFVVYLLARSFRTQPEGEGAFFQQLALLRRVNRLILLGLIAVMLPEAAGIENTITLAVSLSLMLAFMAGAVLQLIRLRRLKKRSA